MSLGNCMKCSRELVRNEIALHRKLINRGAEEFMCLTCMADFFKTDEAFLEQKIEDFKSRGCTLFFM